jgi:hypothetical protein
MACTRFNVNFSGAAGTGLYAPYFGTASQIANWYCRNISDNNFTFVNIPVTYLGTAGGCTFSTTQRSVYGFTISDNVYNGVGLDPCMAGTFEYWGGGNNLDLTNIIGSLDNFGMYQANFNGAAANTIFGNTGFPLPATHATYSLGYSYGILGQTITVGLAQNGTWTQPQSRAIQLSIDGNVVASLACTGGSFSFHMPYCVSPSDVQLQITNGT